METIKEYFNISDKLYSVKYHIFSDNVIIFTPLDEDPCVNKMLIDEYVMEIAVLQRNLIGQYGIFVRGSITLGNLYYGGNYVYGSGLSEAYRLENNCAFYPRIIIDDNIVKKFYNSSEIFCDPINDFVAVDVDNRMFINYCFGFEKPTQFKLLPNEKWNELYNLLIKNLDNIIDTSGNKLPTPFFSFEYTDKQNRLIYNSKNKIQIGHLIVHKSLIERRLLDVTDEQVKVKYIWCKNYHNQVCHRYHIPELFIL